MSARNAIRNLGDTQSSNIQNAVLTRPSDLPDIQIPPRVVIEDVQPSVDAGRFPIKRVLGQSVTVSADIFADGHDQLAAVLLFKHEVENHWSELPMSALGNDRWTGTFEAARIGTYSFTIEGWIDRFATWREALEKRIAARQDGVVDYLIGADLIHAAATRAAGESKGELGHWERDLRDANVAIELKARLALDARLLELMKAHPERHLAARFGQEFRVVVDTARAQFSSWYEMFPRSAASLPGTHGTFQDCERRLPYISEMGFNVLYFAPIHPIGHTHRKGPNNVQTAEPGAVGSPWAIGSEEGGHTAILPELGTLADFRQLVASANSLDLEIALDVAFQVSPDHPYVREHPEWFRWRPDKTVQFAENPPKKYQDIYPFEFENPDWRGLWEELRNVFLFWIELGIRIFRVDNPHTKPFAFWEWLITDIKSQHPDVIFLSEAFTRPKIMYRLAKLGFTQSYTYFSWRNTKDEITQYALEVMHSPVSEYFRPNFWPNTPDILPEYLQLGGRPAFISRLVLAATLSSNYGIYGPAFELMENVPLEPGKEEYLHSEKYEIKHWDIDRPDSLKSLIARVNAARNANRALQINSTLRFHEINNDQIVVFSKHTEDLSNIILVAVNLDYMWTQSGWLRLPLAELGIDPERNFVAHDLLTGARYPWFGPINYVELDPNKINAHIFRITQVS